MNWNWVEKEKGKFKYVNWYYKGSRSNRFPLSALSKTKTLFQNDKKVLLKDSVVLLNGLYQFRIKDSIVLEEYLYKDGYLVKHVNKDKFILNKKQKGKSLSELCEYDYRTVPFKEHYILFRSGNTISKNFIIKQENGIWLHYSTTETMSPIPTEFKGVSLSD